MKRLNDGSILIQGAVDGPFEPTHFERSVRVKGVADPLELHQLVHGRPQSLDHAAKQERIKALIKEIRTKSPGLTFTQAWERLQKTHPDLFDEP
jgi:hypothetical protein